MSWADQPLRCDDCERITYRPSCAGSCAPPTLPDDHEWPCQGTLRPETEAEADERRRRAVEEWAP